MGKKLMYGIGINYNSITKLQSEENMWKTVV